MTVVLFVLAGCGGVRTEPARDDSPLITSSLESLDGLDSVRFAEVPVPAEVDIRPVNGQVFDGSPTNLRVEFAGFFITAGASIEVQALENPDLAIVESSWTTIARTTTETSPTSFNDATPIFRWSVTATPSPFNNPGRWPAGGLLRYRAIAFRNGVPVALPFFDVGAGDCINELRGKSWKDVLARCASPFAPELGAPLDKRQRAAALVSTTPNAAGVAPPYLNRKGQISPDDTASYYRAVDAPTTLDDFKKRYGFGGENEVESTYYNRGDLGIGREMHCLAFLTAGSKGTACYVTNYGTIDGQPAFGRVPGAATADAIARRNAFATVAMLKIGDAVAPAAGNDVQFFVYDAKGALANAAPLDSTGQNPSIPNNCTNCHGGQYDRDKRVLRGSAFLPFDPEAFLFSRQAGFSYDAQSERIRELNLLVRGSGAPPGVVQFIDGLYDGAADRVNARANFNWIPPGWSGSNEAKVVYREVIKPFCRTCHVSQNSEFALQRYEELLRQKQKTIESVCDTKEMPIAEATLSDFLRSPSRAFVVNALSISSVCSVVRSR